MTLEQFKKQKQIDYMDDLWGRVAILHKKIHSVGYEITEEEKEMFKHIYAIIEGINEKIFNQSNSNQ